MGATTDLTASAAISIGTYDITAEMKLKQQKLGIDEAIRKVAGRKRMRIGSEFEGKIRLYVTL